MHDLRMMRRYGKEPDIEQNPENQIEKNGNTLSGTLFHIMKEVSMKIWVLLKKINAIKNNTLNYTGTDTKIHKCIWWYLIL